LTTSTFKNNVLYVNVTSWFSHT